MHDIKFIRDNAAAFDAGLARRDLSPMAADILSMDSAWRALTTENRRCSNVATKPQKRLANASQKASRQMS